MVFSVMEHNTSPSISSQEKVSSPVKIEEFNVFLQGPLIIFSWNSKDISEIAHTLGEPEIDLEPCG